MQMLYVKIYDLSEIRYIKIGDFINNVIHIVQAIKINALIMCQKLQIKRLAHYLISDHMCKI